MVSDELYIGPTTLEPEPISYGERFGRWLIGPLATLFLIVVLVFYVFFSPHRVNGDSMEPSLRHGERTLVTRGYDKPQRGDVIVFTAINERNRPEDLVKRIVALPGDTVSVAGGVATVNGVPEAQGSFFADPSDTHVIEPVTVPQGMVFVMGDNRPVSLDSRYIGFVPLSSTVGKVVVIWAPFDHIRFMQ